MRGILSPVRDMPHRFACICWIRCHMSSQGQGHRCYVTVEASLMIDYSWIHISIHTLIVHGCTSWNSGDSRSVQAQTLRSYTYVQLNLIQMMWRASSVVVIQDFMMVLRDSVMIFRFYIVRGCTFQAYGGAVGIQVQVLGCCTCVQKYASIKGSYGFSLCSLCQQILMFRSWVDSGYHYSSLLLVELWFEGFQTCLFLDLRSFHYTTIFLYIFNLIYAHYFTQSAGNA